MKPPIFSCLDSRVANNGSLYGRFLFGPLPIDLSLTVATVLRRSLLNSKPTFTIVSAEIEGATHEYASLPGIQESVLEILLNLGEIVLTASHENFLTPLYRSLIKPERELFASIRISGPCRLEAKEINWPKGIVCVKPNAYIATLSSNETLAMRVKIVPSEVYKNGKNHSNEKNKTRLFSLERSQLAQKPPSFHKTPFDFFKFQKDTIELPNGNLPSTANTLTLSNSFKITDYTPLSSYSIRKRKVLESTTQLPSVTAFNSYSPSYSFSIPQTSSFRSSETSTLSPREAAQAQSLGPPLTNKSTPLFSLSNPKTRSFDKIVNPTFQTFPTFLKNVSKNSSNRNLELSSQTEKKEVIPSLGSNVFSSTLQKKKQNLKESVFVEKTKVNNKNLFFPLKETRSLAVFSSSYPVEKVNFLIERDDELFGYRHRIIFEIWTNGSISPRQAIFDSISAIIKLIYNFREPVRRILNSL